MVRWKRLFDWDHRDHRRWHDEIQSLLPSHRDAAVPSAIPAKEVTLVALRLKYQIEAVIPCELPEERITAPHSNVLTPSVIKTAKSAGKVTGPTSSSDDHGACVVYCLLIVKHWFKMQAQLELWDADLHNLRATACEVLAKLLIEQEDDLLFLMQEMLLKRYS
ncbi:hypothetical protein KC315_g15929, partial [Hortaea werneckii]